MNSDLLGKMSSKPFGLDITAGLDAVAPVVEANAISRAIIAYKLPRVPDAKSALEEAGALLDMAAEIEHSLMVQYLYSGFAAEQMVAGEKPNSLLREIAIEEMGHLLTVTNLRLMLGLEPYMRRQDESPQQGFDPYPFVLEPLSTASLAKYVAAESPAEDAEMDDKDRAAFRRVLDHLGQQNGPLIHRVGLVYMRLFYLLQEDEAADPSWPEAAIASEWGEKWHLQASDVVGNEVRQSDHIEWGQEADFIGLKVNGLAAARVAIARIAGQGEGGPAPSVSGSDAPSHFLRFLRLFDRVGAAPLSRPVPTLGIDDITAEPAVTLNRLFDIRYEMFLIVLQRFFLAKDGPRVVALDWCKMEMRGVLKNLHGMILKYPRHTDGDPKAAAAAPYFRMPASAVPIDEGSLVQRYDIAKAVSKALVAAAVTLGVNPESKAFSSIAEQDIRL
ncbi:MAG: ferritin-like domain-containing protein [Bosea sp. (in: a-proteobacteria)]